MIPLKGKEARKLQREPDKDHWSVADCFKGGTPPAVVFTHRDYQIGMHTHEFIEVNIVTKGCGRHHMEGNELDTVSGDVFVIPPKVEHGYVNEGELDVFHLLLHPLFIQRHSERLSGLPGYLMLFTVEPYFRRRGGFRHGMRLEGKDFETAKWVAALLEGERGLTGVGREWAVESLACYLTIHLCRCYASSMRVSGEDSELEARHPHWRAVRMVMELVERRPTKMLSLDDLAKAACMQKNYFCRVFRSATGMTPMEYVQRERIREAQRLLLGGGLSVSEVGDSLGFFDTAHFSKVFSRIVGVPPTRYRGQGKR